MNNLHCFGKKRMHYTRIPSSEQARVWETECTNEQCRSEPNIPPLAEEVSAWLLLCFRWLLLLLLAFFCSSLSFFSCEWRYKADTKTCACVQRKKKTSMPWFSANERVNEYNVLDCKKVNQKISKTIDTLARTQTHSHFNFILILGRACIRSLFTQHPQRE